MIYNEHQLRVLPVLTSPILTWDSGVFVICWLWLGLISWLGGYPLPATLHIRKLFPMTSLPAVTIHYTVKQGFHLDWWQQTRWGCIMWNILAIPLGTHLGFHLCVIGKTWLTIITLVNICNIYIIRIPGGYIIECRTWYWNWSEPLGVIMLYYRKVSNIRRTKSQNLNISHLDLQLPLHNILKPSVKRRMEM